MKTSIFKRSMALFLAFLLCFTTFIGSAVIPAFAAATQSEVCVVNVLIGDKVTQRDETYWDNYPSNLNPTISPDDIKLLIGRIMQYGYTGTVSINWRSQNDGGPLLA